MKLLKKAALFMVLITLGILLWVCILRYLSIDSLRLHEHELMTLIYNHFLITIGLYVVIYTLLVGLSVPAAAPMTLAGGFLFGQWMGTCAVIIAATLGATIVFLTARHATQNTIRNAGPRINKMKDGFQKNAWSYLLTLRLLPFSPFVIINLVAAMAQIPLRTFFWATFIGIIPGIFVYVSLGVALKEVINLPITPALIIQPSILLALGGMSIITFLPVIYKRFCKPQPVSIQTPTCFSEK